jgi:acetolactate synthase I/II/III large subunit
MNKPADIKAVPSTAAPSTAAAVFLKRLKAHGVDYFFANGGTDFAPIVEAFAHGQVEGAALPEPLITPHETAAVAMAHGYFLATGKPQALMVHTNVGLANAVMGAINAAADHIPMLICSGRTPVSETGQLGHRTAPINWGQDMHDQAALVRESVKWDFELRVPEQTADLVDRAFGIAMSYPRGPVYLALPREALCAPCPAPENPNPALAPSRYGPHPKDVAAAAEMILAAKSPVVIAHRVGDDDGGFHALRDFAELVGAPVCTWWLSRNPISTDSPMHGGADPGDYVTDADLIIVIDHLVPWLPHRHHLKDGAKVIQIGPDPLHSRFPVRGFRSDLSLAGDAETTLRALEAALKPEVTKGATKDAVAARFKSAAAKNAKIHAEAMAKAEKGSGTPMSHLWVSKCLSDAVSPDAIVFSELGIEPSVMKLTKPGTYYNAAVSGGLGWGLPAALGAQLADRDRIVCATVGDGSYMFANPVACHQIAEAHNLPILTIVFNNGIWNAVRSSALDIFPKGYASKANLMPVTSLRPTPDFCKIAEASRGWAERVENGADLPAAIQRALKVIREERRQALLEVIVQ